MMEWIYWSISWILLTWHQVWDFLIPGGGTWLGTTWPWIMAIAFLVVTVRIILFPIFVKQIRSQRAMQALQPKVKELQTKYKNDPQTLRQETMKLWQEEKVNPLMGCLPMFLQIPVFLGLFHVLNILSPFEKDGAPKTIGAKSLYGWSPAEFDSAAASRLFNAPIPARFADSSSHLDLLMANSLTVKLVAGILVLIMMFTTFMTSRQMILKTGWNPDPQQRTIQKVMLYVIPFSLLLSGWYFPIGVIVYWVTQNIVSFAQQYYVLHKYPPPVTAGAVPASTRNIFARIPIAGEGPAKPPPPERSIPKAKPAQATGGGFVNPVQPAKKSGIFGRKEQPTPTPAAGPAKLGPRPGARPAVKSTPRPTAPSANGSTPDESVSAGPVVGPGPSVGPGPVVGAAPTKAAVAKKAATGAAPKGGQGGQGGARKTQPQKKGGQQRRRRG